jgi:hypothetical protein
MQRVALLAATVGLAAWLGGCGGGGGGDSTPSPAPAPPAPAPGPFVGTHFYAAGIVGSETVGYRLVVADSEVSQGATLLSVPVPASLTMQSTAAYTVDAASPTVTYRGGPVSYFLNAGQLWQLDLSPSKLPTSMRVSSLSDGCQTQMTAPLTASGLDAWVLVTTAGADGNCSTFADNRQAFVRSGSPTTTAPTMVPSQTLVEPVYLTGADGALWWMLATDRAGATPRLVAYGPSLNVVDVAGGGGIQVLNAQGHAAKAPEGTFVRADNTLRRIEATAGALSIGAPQHAFTGPSSLTLLEGSAMYFVDGSGVYKAQGAAPAALLAQPNPGSASTLLLAQTPTVVVVVQQAVGGGVVSAVNKSSGAVQALLQQDAGKNEVWAVRGDRVFYFAAARGSVGELRSIGVDGSGDSGAFSNLLLIGRVLNSVWVRGEMTDIGGTKALLACQPLPGSADCRGSTLLQIDLATLAVTALGPFAGSTGTVWQASGGAAFENVKGAVVEVLSNGAPGSPMRKDIYVFNPGQAGSLKQVNRQHLDAARSLDFRLFRLREPNGDGDERLELPAVQSCSAPLHGGCRAGLRDAGCSGGRVHHSRRDRAVKQGAAGAAGAAPEGAALRLPDRRDHLRPAADHRPLLAHGGLQHPGRAVRVRLPGPTGTHAAEHGGCNAGDIRRLQDLHHPDPARHLLR